MRYVTSIERLGIEKGKLEGEAFALQRLITKRFGSIPSVIAAQIAAASQAQIEAWFDLAIDAPTLEAVFGPTQHLAFLPSSLHPRSRPWPGLSFLGRDFHSVDNWVDPYRAGS